jgi:hypothetical protein
MKYRIPEPTISGFVAPGVGLGDLLTPGRRNKLKDLKYFLELVASFHKTTRE